MHQKRQLRSLESVPLTRRQSGRPDDGQNKNKRVGNVKLARDLHWAKSVVVSQKKIERH